MKTPEEIKSWLNGCKYKSESECGECSLIDQCETNATVLAYIEQLESRLAQVERERDAAVDDLYPSCELCKYDHKKSDEEPCATCGHGMHWEWRGVCAENTKEE